MSRCKACDTIMTRYDLRRRELNNPALLVDLCSRCYSISEYAYGYDDMGIEENDVLELLNAPVSQHRMDNDY